MDRLICRAKTLKITNNQIHTAITGNMSDVTRYTSMYLTGISGLSAIPVGALLHLIENATNKDLGLFIVDSIDSNGTKVIGITTGQSIYKPMYDGYDKLMNDASEAFGNE